jgi:hypothetical protein
MAGIDTYTKLLLHLDNNVIDSEITPKTVTNNNVTFSDTIKKWGYSGVFNGASTYLSVPTSEDFNFGTGDFTIDWWEYRTDYNIWASVISQTGDAWLIGTYEYIAPGHQLSLFISGTGRWSIASSKSMGLMILNTWTHYALTRSGNTFRTFQNGIKISEWTSSESVQGSGNVLIGLWNDGYYKGNIDEVRISKGIARWTSDFTPSTIPYSIASKVRNQAIIIS